MLADKFVVKIALIKMLVGQTLLKWFMKKEKQCIAIIYSNDMNICFVKVHTQAHCGLEDLL